MGGGLVQTLRSTPGGPCELLDHLMHVQADDRGQIEQLDQVDPPLAALYVRHERLMSPEPACHFGLGQACRLPRTYDELDQTRVPS